MVNRLSPLVLCIILYWGQRGLCGMAWGGHGLHMTRPSWGQCWGSSRWHRGATTRSRHLSQTGRKKNHVCFLCHPLCLWSIKKKTFWQTLTRGSTIFNHFNIHIDKWHTFWFICLICNCWFFILPYIVIRYLSGCSWRVLVELVDSQNWQPCVIGHQETIYNSKKSSLLAQLKGIDFPLMDHNTEAHLLSLPLGIAE